MVRVELPAVDLSKLSAHGFGANDRLAADQLAAALESFGFVELVGYRSYPPHVENLRAACDRFFDLDDEIKRQCTHPSALANRGFRARGSEALSYSLGTPSPPDLFESFNCGHDDRVRDGSNPLIQTTPWPHLALPELQVAANRWLSYMQLLSRVLDEMIDMTLGTSFARCSDRGPDTMACIDYRPSSDGAEVVEPGQYRMGAHTDYTTFTILHADPVPGLQIFTDQGWVDVVPAPGSLLLNVGDLLAIVTNDVWPSTLHRVVPMRDGCAPNRRSVAYFHYPNLGVTVEPLPQFGAPRYQPVTVEDHLLAKLSAPKERRVAEGGSTVGDRLPNHRTSA